MIINRDIDQDVTNLVESAAIWVQDRLQSTTGRKCGVCLIGFVETEDGQNTETVMGRNVSDADLAKCFLDFLQKREVP